jgi:hypothetical protein
VVVNDLNLVRVSGAPAEANSPLIVDTDAVLLVSVAAQPFEAVSGRNPQVIQPLGGIEHSELSERDPL